MNYENMMGMHAIWWVFWAGLIAVFWPYRWLRVVPVAVALLSFYPVRTGTTRLLLLCGLMALWMAALIVFRQRRGVLSTLVAGAGVIAGLALLGWSLGMLE